MKSDWTSIKCLIDSLTDDEDLRQELWVDFLSGCQCAFFVERLEVVRIHQRVLGEFQNNVHAFIHYPLSDEAEHALAVLTPWERHIVYLLVLGLPVTSIAEYKGISVARINQLVVSVQKSPLWADMMRDKTKCHSKKTSTMTSGLVLPPKKSN